MSLRRQDASLARMEFKKYVKGLVCYLVAESESLLKENSKN
jgi:hypothetical protein